jgi:hypothetical protein
MTKKGKSRCQVARKNMLKQAESTARRRARQMREER